MCVKIGDATFANDVLHGYKLKTEKKKTHWSNSYEDNDTKPNYIDIDIIFELHYHSMTIYLNISPNIYQFGSFIMRMYYSFFEYGSKHHMPEWCRDQAYQVILF